MGEYDHAADEDGEGHVADEEPLPHVQGELRVGDGIFLGGVTRQLDHQRTARDPKHTCEKPCEELEA